jgi:hypothetical protein
MPPAPRDIDRKRSRQSIVRHLEDFPRQLDALRFGVDRLDLAAFEQAFDSSDPELYTPVQAIERGFGRLQNYIAGMAAEGAKLAGLARRRNAGREPQAQPDFEALRDAEVITKVLCRRLIAAQKSRSHLEHDYVRVAAGDVYAAVAQLLEVAPEFLDRFSAWIEPYLLGPGAQRGSD